MKAKKRKDGIKFEKGQEVILLNNGSFSIGIPKGTRGKVVKIEDCGDGFLVDVRFGGLLCVAGEEIKPVPPRWVDPNELVPVRRKARK